jgi:SAM-dependent methyltransferase
VPDPARVIMEIHRCLRPGGIVLICVPFHNRIHGDPYDYGRYTDFYWRETLGKAGFENVQIDKQGLFWSVLVDMLRDLVYVKTSQRPLQNPWILRLFSLALGMAKRKALQWDEQLNCEKNSPLHGFTTGFGIKAVRPL